MKIDNSILSVDDNHTYQRFWPIVSELWSLLGINPILYWVTDKESDFPFPSSWGKIIKIPTLVFDELEKEHCSKICSMLARIYGCATSVGTNILADIDILPISKDFFISKIEPFPNNSLIHLGSELLYLTNQKKLNANYYIANNEVFSKFILSKTKYLKDVVSWDNKFIEEIKYFSEIKTFNISADQNYEYNEEYFLVQKLLAFGCENNNIILLPKTRSSNLLDDDDDNSDIRTKLKDAEYCKKFIDKNPDVHFFTSSNQVGDFKYIKNFANMIRIKILKEKIMMLQSKHI